MNLVGEGGFLSGKGGEGIQSGLAEGGGGDV